MFMLDIHFEELRNIINQEDRIILRMASRVGIFIWNQRFVEIIGLENVRYFMNLSTF